MSSQRHSQRSPAARLTELSWRASACISVLCLSGCASAPLAEHLDAVQEWTEAFIESQTEANEAARRAFQAATVQGTVVALNTRYTELLANFERAAARRTADCEVLVASALGNKTKTELNDLTQRISLSDANKAAGEPDVRRQYYYRQELSVARADRVENERAWMSVARGRIRAAAVTSACTAAATHRQALARYREEMRALVNAEDCRPEVQRYRQGLDSIRARADELRDRLETPLAERLFRKAADISPAPMWPTRLEVERCLRESFAARSTTAATPAKESIEQTFEEALESFHAVRCLPVNFDKISNPNCLDVAAASCQESGGECLLRYPEGGQCEPTLDDATCHESPRQHHEEPHDGE
ncbi:MAG: hypothetical protein OXM56_06975 [Gammaproteobacteria bacterium]|nr:hypothetical protein [Gammaproteobacteria bacterium]